MSRLLYSATMSLDGVIVGVGGDMSWLGDLVDEESSAEESPDVDGLMADIGALLIGKRTWSGDDPNQGTDAEGAFGGQWQGPSVVLTHEPPAEPAGPHTTFVGDLDEAVALAKEAAGGKYVNILGADVARQCLVAGVLDEILVFIAPVLLGDGTRLYELAGGTNVRLEPINVGKLGPTSLWFRVAR